MNSHAKLIQAIYERGCNSRAGRDAVEELASGGESALDAFLRIQKNPPKSTLHPRDLCDSINGVYCEFARKNPGILIDRFVSGQIEECVVYWALGSANDEHSIDVLIAGLRSKGKFSRWAAAETLIRRKCKQAVGPLIHLLNDRSSFVKSAIVQAMKSNQEIRCPEALPALERMIASKSIQKHSPGTFIMATELVRQIKSESM